MSKHVILVLAHKSPALLKRFVSHLPASDYSFIVHVDAKSDLDAFLGLGPNVSLLQERQNIVWGSFAMVDATLAMLRQGSRSEEAQTFTLISGDTYLIKSPQELTAILDRGLEYIDFVRVDPNSSTYERIKNIYVPDAQIGQLSPTTSFQHRFLGDRDLDWINRAEATRRWRSEFLGDYTYAKGGQWWSLTRRTIQLILELVERDDRLLEGFRFSAIPDEAFFQTAFLKVRDTNMKVAPGLVFTRWDTVPAPYTFHKSEDLDALRRTSCPLARKFDDRSEDIFTLIERSLWNRTARQA